MTKFNIELAVKLENDANAARTALAATFGAMAAINKNLIDGIYAADYDMRTACAGDKRAQLRVMDGITHAAWMEFFSTHDAHHLILDRERVIQQPYTFADSYKRHCYNGTPSLAQFTAEAAGQFWRDNLQLTDARRAKWLNDVLDRTGKDYKNHCTAFKTKMSLRGLDSYGTVATEFLRAVYAVCGALGVECSFNSMYTELRNNRRIDGVPFALVEGLDLTLELHANGNTTLRIGKGLVSALNDMLGVRNDGGL